MPSTVVVFVVGDVFSPVGFRSLVSGDGFGDGQVAHKVVGRGAVPMPLAGRGVDDVARADLGAVTAAGLHESASLGDVEGLADGVGVPRGAGGGSEADGADPDPGGFLAARDAVDPDVSGEPFGRALRGRLLALDFHGSPPCSSAVGSGVILARPRAGRKSPMSSR